MTQAAFTHKIFSRASIAACIFIALCIIGLSHHEMWLDEMHHWLMARDSNSLPELFYNARYDGHPFLWDTLLYFIAQFSHNPIWMQVLNGCFSCIAVILILNDAPFSFLIRVLIVFGYFSFYEYSVISRNYSMGLLLMVCFCLLYRKRSDHYFLLAIVLSIMANTHVLTLFVSLAFFLTLLLDYVFFSRSSEIKKTEILTGTLLYGLSVALAFVQIIPPAGSALVNPPSNFLSWHRFGNSISILTKGFFPIPDLNTIHWWNTNLFVSVSPVVNAILALLVLILPFVFFIKKPIALVPFYITSLCTIIFTFIYQMEATRYCGFVFFSFIASLWIAKYYDTGSIAKMNPAIERIQKIMWQPFLYTVLIVQVIAGVVAWGFDFEQPFSQGKSVADYLRTPEISNDIVAVSSCNSGPPISGYLGEKVFYPQINQWGSFCKWNLPFERVHDDSIMVNVKQIALASSKNVVVVLNHSLNLPSQNDSINLGQGLSIHFLKAFVGSTVPDENYYVYFLSNNMSKPAR